MKTSYKIFFIFFFLKTCLLYSQAPNIQWQKTYGGTGDEEMRSLCQTDDGGFLLVGYTGSIDGDVTDLHLGTLPGLNIWIIRIDSLGNIIWNKCEGGITGGQEGFSIVKTFGNDFVLSGYTSSNDADFVCAHCALTGRDDFLVVKIDSIGNIIWQKCYGGWDSDDAYDVAQTSDSGFIVTGLTYSNDGDVVGDFGNGDGLVVKIDKNGVKQWAKDLGGYNGEDANSTIQSSDGGYLFLGATNSVDGDLSGINFDSLSQVWVVKLNPNGSIRWQKCYGGSSYDFSRKIFHADHDNFFVLATTSSNDGDVTGLHGPEDFWLIKADSSGTILRENCYGGLFDEDAIDANVTSDGGVVMLGIALSDNGQVSGTHGYQDFWVVKIDSTGNFEWGKVLGGSFIESPYAVRETRDGGYIVAGGTRSQDGDITYNHGTINQIDAWVVKLAPLGLQVPETKNNLMDLNISQNNDQLTARFFSKHNQNLQMSFYNLEGKKLFSENVFVSEGINYHSFSCSNFARGMYFLKIDGKDFEQSEKVVVQ